MTEQPANSINPGESIGSVKPVVLHVLHSWGGGVDCFAKDLQAGDLTRTHIFLKSHSRDNLPPFGKELCLYRNLDSEPLVTWPLKAPVMDTELHSAEVKEILDSIIEKWAVGAVIVSSLIGHSLDVLCTGLPTAYAVHDVYPFWPILHEANAGDYSIDYLSQSLRENTGLNIFAEHSAEYWIEIREKLISDILQNNVACISPSAFSKDRVCRISPRLKAARWTVIPHGIDLPAGGSVASSLSVPGRLKVLVPGHINGAKGEILLEELIPELPDGVDLVLLGSAHLSEHFASSRVTTIEHYRRSEMAQIIATIQPDIALIASTVPETYGYVLSEMLQLGVPVICSNIGAYAERAMDLPGITLVLPSAGSFLEALAMFRDNPEKLTTQKENLPFIFPNLHEMANEWANVLPANPPRWQFEFTDDPSIKREVIMDMQLTHLSGLLKVVHAATEKNAKSSNDALELIGRQQSNIERLLESINAQSRQLTAMLAKQDELEAALLNKNLEIIRLTSQTDELKNAFQQQVMLTYEHEKSFKQGIETLQAEQRHEVTALRDEANIHSSEMRVTIDALTDELRSMQSKRGWRLLSFFK